MLGYTSAALERMGLIRVTRGIQFAEKIEKKLASDEAIQTVGVDDVNREFKVLEATAKNSPPSDDDD